jgi:hypothetical protein
MNPQNGRVKIRLLKLRRWTLPFWKKAMRRISDDGAGDHGGAHRIEVAGLFLEDGELIEKFGGRRVLVVGDQESDHGALHHQAR